MNTPRILLRIALLLVVASSTGCHWNRWFRRQPAVAAPVLFPAAPTLEEVVLAINANTGRVNSLQTQGATLNVPGAPAIPADIALQKPRSFRFRAGTNLLGPEIDLGSNDELFWFWAQRVPSPALFYARHDRFALSPARRMLAIDPAWLIEGLGLPEIPPTAAQEGPFPAGPDRLEVRLRLDTPEGPVTRRIIAHSRFAWVLEQHVFDPQGQLLATSKASEHEHYPLDGVSLPKRIEIQVPSAQLQMKIEVDKHLINELQGDAQQLFALPQQQFSSYPLVDIAAPNFSPPGAPPNSAGPAAGSAPAGYGPPPSAYGPAPAPYGGAPPSADAPAVPAYPQASRLPEPDPRPKYRGFTERR